MTNPEDPVNDDQEADGMMKEEEATDKPMEYFLPVSLHNSEGISMNGNKIPTEVTVNYKDYSLCNRLKIDHPFRRRFIHTVWLFWAFVGLGWMVGQMGPSFPDLRLIVHEDLDTASWLFTIFSVGYMIGSFVGGILYDRFNKLLLIAFSTLLMAVFTVILPWCTSLPVMLLVRFMAGIGAGGLDTGGNADLVSLWDEEGKPYMQALHFCFGFGGIISPLVTEPFLAKKECLLVNSINSTDSFYSTEQLNGSISMTTSAQNTSSNSTCEDVYGESNIHISYLVSFFIIFSSCVPFFVMYFNILRKKKPHIIAADKSEIPRPDKLPFKLKVIFLVLLFGFMMTYCAVEDTFSGFLATFCINHLNWSKGASSFATSTHWAAFSVGRFSGIFLIKFFKPVQLLCTYCIFLMSAFVGLLIVSITMTTDLVWVFIAIAGFSMSIIFPCIFTWTEESILKVSGMISSMLLIAASSGLMLNPRLLGYLMDKFSPMWFVYLLLAESCLCFSLFMAVFILVRMCVNVKGVSTKFNAETVFPAQEMVPLHEMKLE